MIYKYIYLITKSNKSAF